MSSLTPDNHELMAFVRERISHGYPMTGIAHELKLDVNDLCDWIMKVYREPKKKRTPYLNRGSPAASYTAPSRAPISTRGDARRLANWKRQREAAAAARKSIAVPTRSERNMADHAEAE